MSEYAVMPLADYKGICDKVREKIDVPPTNLLENATFEIREINEQYHDIFLCSTPFRLEDDVVYTLDFPNAEDNSGNLIYIAAAEWNTSNYNTGSILVSDLPCSFSPAELQDVYGNLIPESREYRIFIYKPDYANYIDTTDVSLTKADTEGTIKSGEVADRIDEVYEAGQISVLDSSEFLKGKETGNAVTLANVSRIEHNVGVNLSVDAELDVSNQKVLVCGANLLNTDRVKGTLASSGSNTSPREFNFDKYYDGFTRTNYWYPQHSETKIEDGTITVNTIKEWYGVAIPFKVKPNTQYILKGKYTGDKPYVRVAFYDENGNWLCESTTVFTTPANAVTAILSIVSQQANGIVTATNLQLEYGTTATEYMPYIEPTEYTSNADGVVEGVKSIYPTTVISAENEGVIITADYYKDIDKVINGLTTAVALSGGE